MVVPRAGFPNVVNLSLHKIRVLRFSSLYKNQHCQTLMRSGIGVEDAPLNSHLLYRTEKDSSCTFYHNTLQSEHSQ